MTIGGPCQLLFDGTTITATGSGSLFTATSVENITMSGTCSLDDASLLSNFATLAAVTGFVSDLVIEASGGFTGALWNLYEGEHVQIVGLSQCANLAGFAYVNGTSDLEIANARITITLGTITSEPIYVGTNSLDMTDILLSNIIINGSGATTDISAMVVGPNPGYTLQGVTIEDCTVRDYGHDALDVLACTDVTIRNLKTFSSDVVSILSERVAITESFFYHALGSGLVIGDPSSTQTTARITVTGCTAVGCGQLGDTPATEEQCGILVIGNTSMSPEYVLVNNCVAYDDGGGTQAYGVSVAQYASTVSISNSNLDGNVTDPTYVGTTGVSGVTTSNNN